TSPYLFSDPAPPPIYPLSLHDALPIFHHPPSAIRHPPSAIRHPLRSANAPRDGVSGRRRRADVSQLDPDQRRARASGRAGGPGRSEEHTSELQSRGHLVCRLLLEKKKT